ncbi:MAG: hypothetical protein JNL60_19870 [Bacteroidia bacterium]|nr:hypothetical protein [Bacteroidia bacterium]
MVNKRRRVIIVILLVLSLGNYFRIHHNDVRMIEFLSIFLMGALTGILLIDIVQSRRKDKES